MDRRLKSNRRLLSGVKAPSRRAYLAAPLPIERELRRLFPDLDATVVFDIGSCEGEDAIRYASLFRSAQVFAVEALPANVRLIMENIARHPESRIKVLPYALSDSSGKAMLYVSSGRPPGMPDDDWDYGNKSSSLLPPDRHLDVHPWVRFDQQIEVDVETLANLCRNEAVTHIDLIHIDVQGAELAVLRGAGPLLEHVGAIWMEVEAIPLYQAQPLKGEVEQFMTGHGFVRLLDTVDKVSGDQLYYNPRIVRPRRGSIAASIKRSLKLPRH